MTQLRIGGAVLDIKYPRTTAKRTLILVFLVCMVTLMIVFSRNDGPDVEKDEYRRGRDVRAAATQREIPVQRDEGVIVAPVGSENSKSKVSHDLWSKMVIDNAKPDMNKILQVQQYIVRNQVNEQPNERYNINATLSDTIPMDRAIEDTRPPVCRNIDYEYEKLPTASVVIPFYNEVLSMLLRTVHSILNRTPDNLLKEVILVDDCSTYEYLLEPLDKYIPLLPKTRLIRNTKREGLIKSRLTGMRASTGEVTVFLDAHTEANVGWLEPLLFELLKHPKNIIQPFVDGIDAWSIDYTSPPTMYKGSFSWDLRYTWLRVSDHESTRSWETGHPFFSPTLVGCAIAVNKAFFEEFGSFDEDLKVWGGENLELGFRAWMCGSNVVTVPCSRVGHVFKNFPYKFDGDKDKIVQKNLMRVADTWMDDLAKYFYASSRIYEFKRVDFTAEEKASVQRRKDLRKKLKCESFRWYMGNVIPEVDVPPMDAVYYGEIMSLKSRACWEMLDDNYVGMTYYCYEHKIIPRNNFWINRDGLLVYHQKCVNFHPPTPVLQLEDCPESNFEKFGKWELVNKGHTWGQIRVKKIDPATGENRYWCIAQVTNVLDIHNRQQMPQIGVCDENNSFQIWAFGNKFDFSLVP